MFFLCDSIFDILVYMVFWFLACVFCLFMVDSPFQWITFLSNHASILSTE